MQNNRRGFLVGLAALPVLQTIVPLPAEADPFPGYLRERTDTLAAIDAGGMSEAEEDRLFARWGELDTLAMTNRPTTIAGAIASIEYARREYVQFKLNDDEACGDKGDRLLLALLDGALGVLRNRSLTSEVRHG